MNFSQSNIKREFSINGRYTKFIMYILSLNTGNLTEKTSLRSLNSSGKANIK